LIADFTDIIAHIYADCYAAYPEIAGAIPLTQSKSNTYQIEQNNGYQRHWLASFHRKSRVVTRSLAMLNTRLKLFARYRINGNFSDLTALLRQPSPYTHPKSILK
jgi:IS1 family transposase